MSFGSVEQANSWAPIASASSFFAGEVEKAVVSQPSARSMSSAMCPRPPIPITATLLAASIPKRRIGAKTVTPPQRSGAATALSMASGSAKANRPSRRIRSATPP